MPALRRCLLPEQALILACVIHTVKFVIFVGARREEIGRRAFKGDEEASCFFCFACLIPSRFWW
jgi:hypothetical protein